MSDWISRCFEAKLNDRMLLFSVAPHSPCQKPLSVGTIDITSSSQPPRAIRFAYAAVTGSRRPQLKRPKTKSLGYLA